MHLMLATNMPTSNLPLFFLAGGAIGFSYSTQSLQLQQSRIFLAFLPCLLLVHLVTAQ